MMRNQYLCVLSILPCTSLVWATDQTRPPSIVLIVADDLGYGDLGCYGSQINHTPHIDRLAANGLRFADFHSAGPMCTPTRAAMLTGLYQQRFGRMFEGPLSGQSHRDTGLPLQAVTIAELLKSCGYATACFGKWHLGYQPPFLPPSQGFDEFRGLGSGDGDHHTHIDRSGNPDWWHNNELVPEQGYTAELLTKHSIEFIKTHRDKPFFLYVPHLAIHFPWQGPNDPPHRQAGENYDNDKWGIIPEPMNVAPHVKAMVESIDQSVGEIIGALQRLQIDERTIVFFTSDNGGYLNYGATYKNISSNGPLRGQKGSLYEGGHRVPMIAYWPGKIAAAVTHATGNSIDLFPTLASLAGVSVGHEENARHDYPATWLRLPADVQRVDGGPDKMKLDGFDLTQLLLDGKSLPQRTLFWRRKQQRAVRSGPWKLCVTAGKAELYNLDVDLREQNDLSRHKPDLVNRLRRALDEWQNDVNSSAMTR